MNKKNICKNCEYWNGKQAELDYNSRYGICTCFKWEFTTTNDSDLVLLDRAEPSNKYMSVHRFESQKNVIPFGDVNKSNYCLVSEENYGCIHHKKLKELRS